MDGRGELDAAVLPLFRVKGDAIVAYRGVRPIGAREFIRDIETVAGLLPPGRPVINVLSDRYHFAVGFAAALLQGEVTLMPGSHAPGPLADLRKSHPDAVVLHEPALGLAAPLAGPEVAYPETAAETAGTEAGTRESAIPGFRGDQAAAILFTSGSTGKPVAHRKTWGALARTARQCAPRLSIHPGQFKSLVATVPPQHMFGLEASVLLPLQLGIPLAAERPFYPADIAAALARLPRPRLLVTTPVHLRSLVAEDGMSGLADYVLAATATLDPALAKSAEAALAAPLFEIYGCTELGQLAWRRPALDNRFAPLPSARIEFGEETAHGTSLHGENVLLGDVLAPEKMGRFRIVGRHQDLINIGGKRSSLAYLTAELLALPGVKDGVFINVPHADEASARPTRLACLVVAPTLCAADIRAALALRIDPAFLPRPLACVKALPREATGKLTERSAEAWAVLLREAHDAVL